MFDRFIKMIIAIPFIIIIVPVAGIIVTGLQLLFWWDNL